MTTRAAIVAEARSWIGTPFFHQGYRKDVGCDCIGLIAGVGLALAIDGAQEWRDDPQAHSYTPQPDPRLLLTLTGRFLDRVDPAPTRLADILMLRFETDPMHFALVSALEPMYIIHALTRLGCVTEHRVDFKWQSRVMRVYGFRGIS